MMQRKHFELIAKALAAAKPLAGDPAENFGWEHTTKVMADYLRETNPNFNRARFLTAANGS